MALIVERMHSVDQRSLRYVLAYHTRYTRQACEYLSTYYAQWPYLYIWGA
jgi:hypothetical protein